MKKLLFQLDTDPIPNTFDTVVAYDGGADHVTVLGGVNPDNVGRLVEGAIFTRAPGNKKFTALFITGSEMAAGEAVLEKITRQFFGNFRVSVMLDSNGANTTAAAVVASLRRGREIAGQRAVILAGTGPVGQRAAVMLALGGATVTVTSRQLARAETVCAALNRRFQVNLGAAAVDNPEALTAALDGAEIVLATGAAGVTLLPASIWQSHASLKVIMDANSSPPAGIEGIELSDRGSLKYDKQCFGALGFGGLKLETHRCCIEMLFEANDQVLDAERILAVATELASRVHN
ncbi:MAG: methylenetetrahydrofolate dehydrogenase [Gammaproteobacteria bacterium]|nr:methylenetetrahydrofolate dehydrogenase [Gammaproteobacteria bacterium]